MVDKNWIRVKSYLTPGIGLPEYDLRKNKGLVLYHFEPTAGYAIEGHPINIRRPGRAVEQYSERVVKLNKVSNGPQFDFIIAATGTGNTRNVAELWSTINWVKQIKCVPMEFNRGEINCSPAELAHLLVICAPVSFGSAVKDKIKEVIEYLDLSHDKVYISGDLNRNVIITEGMLDVNDLFDNITCPTGEREVVSEYRRI